MTTTRSGQSFTRTAKGRSIDATGKARRTEATIAVRDGLGDEVFLTITTTSGQVRRYGVKRDEWAKLIASPVEPPEGYINIPLECGHIAQGKKFLNLFLRTGGSMECHQCGRARNVVVQKEEENG